MNKTYTTFSLTILMVFVGRLYAQTGAEQINNWEKLDATRQISAKEEVQKILNADSNVLNEFKIPLNMTYYSTNLDKKYTVKYPNNKTSTVVVSYVPLQFVSWYETELRDFYKEDAKNSLSTVPRLEVVLAIHYTESNFIPTAVNNPGTSNPAYGMMQLSLITAKDLYRMNQSFYDDFYKINGSEVSFFSTKHQIALTIAFLPNVKNYSRSNETSAITRYNGSGDEAKKYAALVLNRARLFKKLKSAGKEISPEQFKEEYSKPEVKTTINTQLEVKGYQPLTDSEYLEAIEKALLVYEYQPKASSGSSKPAKDEGEIKIQLNGNPTAEIPITQIDKTKQNLPTNGRVEFPAVPDNGFDFYLKIDKGRTIFSHFYTMRDMVYTMTLPQNKHIKLEYMDENNKPVKTIESLYDFDPKSKYTIKPKIKEGDEISIYLPPGMVIKGDRITKEGIKPVAKKILNVGSEE